MAFFWGGVRKGRVVYGEEGQFFFCNRAVCDDFVTIAVEMTIFVDFLEKIVYTGAIYVYRVGAFLCIY